jgi:HD superfamily phosphohydrolase
MSQDPAAALRKFEVEIVAWADALLEPYVDRVEERAASETAARLGAKELNDAVWGTIVLQPLEILVLDSPILQRLRRIRQLGLVHLVYPSALHTRFEHSLGALQQVSRVIASINSHSASRGPLIPESYEKLLRLAALCHDVGHGLMSHVSENALDRFPEIEDLRKAFDIEHQVEKASISEIAAYHIIGSSQFRRMIDVAEGTLRSRALPVDAADLLRNTVIGKQIYEPIPLLHELISGPFDADKLDYMTRDATMSGVPVVTDIPRLVQKVRATEFALGELPLEVQKSVRRGKRASYWLTGIAVSGGRTLDELLIGRTLLFDKLYRHQKVRACEAMVGAILRELREIDEAAIPLLPYRLTDDEICDLTFERIASLVGDVTVEVRPHAEVATDLARRLRARDAFVRAYAFASNMPLDPYRADQDHVNGLRRLRRASVDPTRRAGLIDAIDEQLIDILGRLNRLELVSGLPTGDAKPYIWVDPPQPPSGAPVIASAYLLGQERRWIRFGEEAAETPSWTNAYLLTRDLGYVFTTTELAPFVFLAAERVAREKFGIHTPEDMYGYAKQTQDGVETLRRDLAAAGYYDNAPFDLRPLPERLTQGDVPARLDMIATRVSGYQGPVRIEDLKEEKRPSLATSARIQNWLRQFETNDLIDAGLRALDHIEFVGREALVDGLDTFLAGHPEFHEGALCALGDPKDSSAVLTYMALDAGDAYGMKSEQLPVALNASKPIVFVDDFIGRGSQAISLVENWLGEEPTTDLGEERGPSLEPRFRDALKSAKVAFVFSSGTDQGAKDLEQRCQALGIDAITAITHTALPSVHDEQMYENAAQREAFVEACKTIGRELLLEPSKGHDEAWTEGRRLGYGDLGLLVVFPYNTPTQTVTCLWKTGVANGNQWDALFPRRKKR